MNKKSDRELVLEKRIADMEEKFRIFQANLKQTVPPKSKGKGRGKKSTVNENQFSDEVSKEAERRLRSFLQSSGVNFINNLHTAFAFVDSKSVKNTVKSSVSFYAFWIYKRKSCT